MDFKTIQEYFPMKKTLIGFYSTDQSFQAHCFEDVKDIDTWKYSPLSRGTGYYPFIYYNEEQDEFECWIFAYRFVQGYYTDDVNGEDYQLITNEPDFGIEIIDPFHHDKYHIIFTPYAQNDYEEIILQLYAHDKYRQQLELAAYRWNPKAYIDGKIMTTYDAVKNFCITMEN